MHVNIQEISDNIVSVEVNTQFISENSLPLLYLKHSFCEKFVDSFVLKDILLGALHCNYRIYKQDHILGFWNKTEMLFICFILQIKWLFFYLQIPISYIRYTSILLILIHSICFEYLAVHLFRVVHPEFRVSYIHTCTLAF